MTSAAKLFLLFFLLTLNCFSINAQEGLLYPGDTNNDGVANHYDLLPIGLAYNRVNFERDILFQNITWELKPFFDTVGINPPNPITGFDISFADCDGNGIVDSLDIDAIVLNYDSLQTDAFPPPMPINYPDTLFTDSLGGNPQISIDLGPFSSDTLMPNDTLSLDIDFIFPETLPDSLGVLGVAFAITYNDSLVKDSLTRVVPDTAAGDLMFIAATGNEVNGWRTRMPGRIEFAAAGRGLNVLNQTRRLAQMIIIIEDDIIRTNFTKIFKFEIERIIALDSLKQVRIIDSETDSFIISVVGQNDLKSPTFDPQLTIYPNPVKDQIQLHANKKMSYYSIVNTVGKTVIQKKVRNNKYQMVDVGLLPRGLYYLIVDTSSGKAEKPFIKL